MANWYLKLVGKLAATIGKFDNYSQEHSDFLSSGYVCPNCKETLMSSFGIPDIVCLSANGENVSLLVARFGGEKFQCLRCKHTWKFRDL